MVIYYLFFIIIFFNYFFLKKNYLYRNLINKFIYIYFFISLVSQIGDILFHILKDYQKLKIQEILFLVMVVLLDRIDGMIFAFPIFSYLIFFKYFKFFK